MKAVNERGKLFGVINIIDFIFIVLVVFMAVVGFLYLNTSGFTEGEPVTVYYTVELEGLKEGFGELVKESETLKDSIKGFYLGEIYTVDVITSMMWTFNEETREYTQYFPPNEEVLHITVKSDGYETDSVVVSEGHEIRIGRTMYIEGKGFVLSGYIVNMWTEPQEEE